MRRRRAVVLVALVAVWTLLAPRPAQADNCGSLSDCFFTLAAALAVLAAVALLVAGIIALPALLGGLGGLSLGAGGAVVLGGSVAIPTAAATAIAVAEALAAAAAAAAAAGSILMMSRPSGKERGSDIPSWAKGSRPNPGETPNQAAERVLSEKYGPGNYPRGPGSEFNKIKKFFERLLRRER
ncbi:MAG TPA: hypothetical protein VHF25_01815 [Nitriliruptorales bacterium]|nr:hypothetical protein [Nitriliruptorales bacterium]